MNDNLTNFDKYMLKKRGEYKRGDDNGLKSDYDNYILNELRRTEPSDKPVLKEYEYFALQNGNSAVKEYKDEKTYGEGKEKSKIFPPFRKYGKIILVVYVIIMLALASILIATNITSNGLASSDNAGAMSDISKSNTPDGQIRPMSIDDEETEESNWFDRLCDSLNK